MIESSWFKGLERVSLTGTGRTGQTRPRRYVAECRKVGNNRPKSGGRDRRPRGEQRGLAAAPAPVPGVTSPGNGKKWRDNIRRGGSRAHQSEQRKTGGISPAASHHQELPEAAIQGPWGRTYSCGWPDGCGAGKRASRSRWVPAPIPGSVLSSGIHPKHDGCNRPDNPEALADGF